MALNKSNGHATTSVLAGTDHAVVKPASIQFPPAPTQNGQVPKG